MTAPALILTALALGQSPGAGFRPAIIAGPCPAVLHTPLSPEAGDALIALGDDHAAARRTAERAIRRLPGPERTLALIRGCRSRDAEIRAACRRIIVSLYVCRHCDGTRICPVVRWNEQSGYTHLCNDCGGLFDRCQACKKP
jgi:hypothetical protein